MPYHLIFGGCVMHKFVLALTALAVALPAQAAPPKARALQDIYKAGFTDCAPAMEKFVEFLHEDDETYSYVGKFAIDKTNQSSASAITVVKYPDGQGVASITGTKNAAGACDVVLTHTLVVPGQTCDELRTTAFKDWKLFSQMNESNVYQDPTTPNGHAVLSPVGDKGCLMVKHLIGYGV